MGSHLLGVGGPGRFRRRVALDLVPGPLAALRALHVRTRPASRGLPADAAQLPDGPREAARAADHPRPRMGLHRLGPAPRQDRGEQSLEETHSRSIFHLLHPWRENALLDRGPGVRVPRAPPSWRPEEFWTFSGRSELDNGPFGLD